MPMIELALATILVAIIAFFIVSFLRSSYVIVPEEERLVIYRLGRFDRVAGPGRVRLSRDMDKVQRRFSIRNGPSDCLIDDLHVYGLPVGLTLNLWWCYDPVRAAGGDSATLRDLVLFDESERRSQLAVELRDSLVRQIAAMEQRKPLAATATIVDKIVPILPGVSTCIEILTHAQQDLARTLPRLGIFLDMNHPIVITRVHPPDDMIRGFSRDRAAALLRLQFPNLPDSMMLHLLESIEGLEPLRIHEIRQVGENGGAGIAAEARWTEDDTLFRAPLAVEPAPPQGKTPDRAETVADQPASEASRLSRSDLAVLKRVPRERPGQRRAA